MNHIFLRKNYINMFIVNSGGASYLVNKASNMYNTISKKVPNLHITDRLTKKPRNLRIKDVGEVYFKDLNFDYYNGDKYNWWLDHVSKKYQDENQDDLICIVIICYQIEKKLHNIKDINKIRDNIIE